MCCRPWRSSDPYFLTVFGWPGFEDTWTLRFLDHHVLLNLTIIDERWIAATPDSTRRAAHRVRRKVTTCIRSCATSTTTSDSLCSKRRPARTPGGVRRIW
nr:DUF3500 domain-containing protein [Nocardia carnea]